MSRLPLAATTRTHSRPDPLLAGHRALSSGRDRRRGWTEAQALADKIQAITQEWTDANKELLDKWEVQREIVDTWEIKAREAIIANYHATGNKALRWLRRSRRHQVFYEPGVPSSLPRRRGMFLTLNKKEFDDFCKTSSKPAWVEVSHVPTATISPDLKG